MIVIWNGAKLDAQTNLISPANRSFRYGDGLFETIRCSNGRVLWADAHYKRMQSSAATLHMRMPANLGYRDFIRYVEELVAQNHPKSKGARVRFSLFRNDGGLYTPMDDQTSFLLESSAIEGDLYADKIQGISLTLFPTQRKAVGPLSRLKSSSALLYVMASHYKRVQKTDDCLIMNTNGRIAEATSSNIFLFKDGSLVTPGLEEGCVDGVMRRVLIGLARQSGMVLYEKPIEMEDVETADELFLSNAIAGIQWVRTFGNRKLGHKSSMAFRKKLLEAAIDWLNSPYPDH